MNFKYSLIFILLFTYTANALAQFGQSNYFAATKTSCPIITDEQLNLYFKQYTDWCDKHNSVCSTSDINPKNKEYADRIKKIINKSILKDANIDVKAYVSKKINIFSSPCKSIRISTGLMDILNEDELLVVLVYETGHIVNKNYESAFKKSLIDKVIVKSLSESGTINDVLTEKELLTLNDEIKNHKYSKRKYYAADSYVYEQLSLMKIDPSILCKVLKKENNIIHSSHYKEERSEKIDKYFKKN